jgi:hypothetical protein
MITQGIDLAVSRAEAGLDKEEGAIGALLSNIKLIGTKLMNDEGEVKEGEGDLEKAMLTLENEIRLRSTKLTSSRVATGFVNEILSVVSGYADRVRAKQISDEFLKGETSLKKTERLLKDLAPKSEPVDKYLIRIRQQLLQRGMNEEDLEKLVRRMEAQGEPKKPSKLVKLRKPVQQAVADGLTKRLKDLKVDDAQIPQLSESLGGFIEEKSRDRVREVKAEAEGLRHEVRRRERVLQDVPVGIVMWGDDGKATLVNALAQEALGGEAAPDLSESLKNALGEWEFPLTESPDLEQNPGLTEADLQLLTVTFRALKSEDGEVVGAVLAPASAS